MSQQNGQHAAAGPAQQNAQRPALTLAAYSPPLVRESSPAWPSKATSSSVQAPVAQSKAQQRSPQHEAPDAEMLGPEFAEPMRPWAEGNMPTRETASTQQRVAKVAQGAVGVPGHLAAPAVAADVRQITLGLQASVAPLPTRGLETPAVVQASPELGSAEVLGGLDEENSTSLSLPEIDSGEESLLDSDADQG